MTSAMIILGANILVNVLTVAPQDNGALTRELVLARFERLHNLIVDYNVTIKYTPRLPPEYLVRKDANGKVSVVHTGTRVTSKEFSLLRDRCMYLAEDKSWDREFNHPDLKSILERTMYVRTPDRCEQFWANPADIRTFMGEISNYVPLPEVGEIEVSLGLRARDAPDQMTEKDILAMTLANTEDGKIRLHGPNHYGWPQEWILDPDLGYAAVRYRLCKPDGTVTDEHTMDDFKPIDGLMLPFRVRVTSGSDPNKPWTTRTIAVTTYRLNDPNNTPERYRINWPEGTRVMDVRAGIGFRTQGNALRYVGDDRIAQIGLDQISRSIAEEPDNAKASIPSIDSNGNSSTRREPLGGPNDARVGVAAAVSPRSNVWLWYVVALAGAIAGAALWLKSAGHRENPVDD